MRIGQYIQIFMLNSGITVDMLMKVVLISALVIIGMFFVKDAVPDGENWVSLHPLKIEQTDGWICILRNGDSGQHCYSEGMMLMIEAWRDEVRYLPTKEKT